MKKLLVCLLAWSLALAGLVPAAMGLEASDVTGVWYLQILELEGVTVNPADMGMEITMTLDQDGVLVMEIPGQEARTGIWKLEGASLLLGAEGDLSPLTLVDGLLVGEQDGALVTYGREPAAGFVPAPVADATELSAFDGDWTPTMMSIAGGQTGPAAMMGGDGVTISLSAGRFTRHAVIEGEAQTSPALTGKLEDGALVFSETLRAQLHEDGTLSLVQSMDGTALTTYYERLEAGD